MCKVSDISRSGCVNSGSGPQVLNGKLSRKAVVSKLPVLEYASADEAGHFSMENRTSDNGVDPQTPQVTIRKLNGSCIFEVIVSMTNRVYQRLPSL